MTFTFGKAYIVFLGCGILVAVLGQDDEWIDPTDMFQYDETSKTMKRKLRDKEESNWNAEVGQCLKALYFLRKEIQNVKLKAHDFMEQEGLNLDPGSKLAQLINSIQHLTDNDEDFHTIPNQCLTYCIKTRTSTMMLLDRFAPELLKITTFLSEGAAHWLLLAVTLLPLFVYKLAKCFRRNGEQQEDQQEEDQQEDQQEEDQQEDQQQEHQQEDQQQQQEEEQEQPGEIERPGAKQPPVYQNNGHPGDEERHHSVEYPPNMPVEVLGSEAANDPGQQSWEDCYDENYELIKPPTPETQPAIPGH